MTEQEILNRARGIMDFVLQTADRVPNSRNCAKKNSETEHVDLSDDDIMSLDEAEHADLNDDDFVSLGED